MTRTGESLDREQSKALAEEIRAEPKLCYQNAIHAMWHLMDRLPADEVAERLAYVEGYAGKFDVPHAWVELDGTILDPTLALAEDDGVWADFWGDDYDAEWEQESRASCRAEWRASTASSYKPVRRYSPLEAARLIRQAAEEHSEMGAFTDGLETHKAEILAQQEAETPSGRTK
jgi:hypothetical protein